MFAAAGWQVVTLKWGRPISSCSRARVATSCARLEQMPNEEYQRMLRVDAAEVADRRLCGEPTSAEPAGRWSTIDAPPSWPRAVRDLGGHDLGLLVDTYRPDADRPPDRGLRLHGQGPRASHRGPPEQPLGAAQRGADDSRWRTPAGVDLADPWQRFAPAPPRPTCAARRGPRRRRRPSSPPRLRCPTSLAGPPPADLDPGRPRTAARPTCRATRPRSARGWSPAARTWRRRPTSAAGSTRPASGRSPTGATGSPTTPSGCCAGRR